MALSLDYIRNRVWQIWTNCSIVSFTDPIFKQENKGDKEIQTKLQLSTLEIKAQNLVSNASGSQEVRHFNINPSTVEDGESKPKSNDIERINMVKNNNYYDFRSQQQKYYIPHLLPELLMIRGSVKSVWSWYALVATSDSDLFPTHALISCQKLLFVVDGTASWKWWVFAKVDTMCNQIMRCTPSAIPFQMDVSVLEVRVVETPTLITAPFANYCSHSNQQNESVNNLVALYNKLYSLSPSQFRSFCDALLLWIRVNFPNYDFQFKKDKLQSGVLDPQNESALMAQHQCIISDSKGIVQLKKINYSIPDYDIDQDDDIKLIKKFSTINFEDVNRNKLIRDLNNNNIPIAQTSKKLVGRHLSKFFEVCNTNTKRLILALVLGNLNKAEAQVLPTAVLKSINQLNAHQRQFSEYIKNFNITEYYDIVNSNRNILFQNYHFQILLGLMFWLCLVLVSFIAGYTVIKLVIYMMKFLKWSYEKLIDYMFIVLNMLGFKINRADWLIVRKSENVENLVLSRKSKIDIVGVVKFTQDSKDTLIEFLSPSGNVLLMNIPNNISSKFLDPNFKLDDLPMMMPAKHIDVPTLETAKPDSKFEFLPLQSDITVQLYVKVDSDYRFIGTGFRMGDAIFTTMHSLKHVEQMVLPKTLNEIEVCVVGKSNKRIVIDKIIALAYIPILDTAIIMVSNDVLSQLQITKLRPAFVTYGMKMQVTLYGNIIQNGYVRAIRTTGIAEAKGQSLEHFCSTDEGCSGAPIIFGTKEVLAMHRDGHARADCPNSGTLAALMWDAYSRIVQPLVSSKKFGKWRFKVKVPIKDRDRILIKPLNKKETPGWDSYEKAKEYEDREWEVDLTEIWYDDGDSEYSDVEEKFDDLQFVSGKQIEFNVDPQHDFVPGLTGKRWSDYASQEETDYAEEFMKLEQLERKFENNSSLVSYQFGETNPDEIREEKFFKLLDGKLILTVPKDSFRDDAMFVQVLNTISTLKVSGHTYQLFEYKNMVPKMHLKLDTWQLTDMPWEMPKNYGPPQTSYENEQMSFLTHVANYAKSDCLRPPSVEEFQQVQKHLVELYNPAKWQIPVNWNSKEQILEKIYNANQNASCGYETHREGCTLKQLRENKTDEWIVEKVLDLLRKINNNEFEAADKPIRVFIKQEIHKMDKIDSNLFRLISSVDILCQFLDALVFDPSLTSAINHFSEIPGQTGLSFLYGGADKFMRSFKRQTGKFMAIDKKGYDWTTKMWQVQMDAKVRWELCSNFNDKDPAHLLFKKVYDARYMALSLKQFVLSKGILIQQNIIDCDGKPLTLKNTVFDANPAAPRITPSGSKITIDGNSREQAAGKVLAAIREVGLFNASQHEVKAMGDDTLERCGDDKLFIKPEVYVKHLAEMGMIPKYANESDFGKGDFCSHEFKVDPVSGKFVSFPNNMEKHKAALKMMPLKDQQFIEETLGSLLLEHAFDTDENYQLLENAMKARFPNSIFWRSREQFRRFHVLSESVLLENKDGKSRITAQELKLRNDLAFPLDESNILAHHQIIERKLIEQNLKEAIQQKTKLLDKNDKIKNKEKSIKNAQKHICNCDVVLQGTYQTIGLPFPDEDKATDGFLRATVGNTNSIQEEIDISSRIAATYDYRLPEALSKWQEINTYNKKCIFYIIGLFLTFYLEWPNKCWNFSAWLYDFSLFRLPTICFAILIILKIIEMNDRFMKLVLDISVEFKRILGGLLFQKRLIISFLSIFLFFCCLSAALPFVEISAMEIHGVTHDNILERESFPQLLILQMGKKNKTNNQNNQIEKVKKEIKNIHKQLEKPKPKMVERVVVAAPVKLKGSGDYKLDQPRFSGKGDYNVQNSSFLGSALDLGWQGLKHGISSLIGSGDYSGGGMLGSAVNSIIKTGVSDNGPPLFKQRKTANGVFQLRKRECLGEVYGSGGFFKVIQLTINPGLDVFAPWGEQIAIGFEEWKAHGIVFEYESTSTNYSSSIALGDIIMATQYNIKEKPFTNVQEMLEYNNITKSNPSKSAFHGVECSFKTQPLAQYYVRAEAKNESDEFVYDFAKFSLGINTAAPADTVIGRLWVTYDIDLSKPLLSEMQENTGTLTQFKINLPIATTTLFSSTTAVAETAVFATQSDQLVTLKPYDGVSTLATGVNFIKFLTPGRYAIRYTTTTPQDTHLFGVNTVSCTDSNGVVTAFTLSNAPGGTDIIQVLSNYWITDICGDATAASYAGQRSLWLNVDVMDSNCPQGQLTINFENAMGAAATAYIEIIGLKDKNFFGNASLYTYSEIKVYDPELADNTLTQSRAFHTSMKNQLDLARIIKSKQQKFINQLTQIAEENKREKEDPLISRRSSIDSEELLYKNAILESYSKKMLSNQITLEECNNLRKLLNMTNNVANKTQQDPPQTMSLVNGLASKFEKLINSQNS